MRESGGFVFLTSSEVAEADRLAMEEFKVPVAVMMENAGERAAELARKLLGNVEGRSVVCLAGKGNNGGDGLVAGRHLRNWGAEVSVVLGAPRSEMRDVPASQLALAERMGVRVLEAWQPGLEEADMFLDALLGYNSKGDPREPVAGLVKRANGSKGLTLALDIPSGLDATSGVAGTPCVEADATVTFGWPKAGFLEPEGRRLTGDLYLGDISMPLEVYRRYSGQGAPFGKESLVRVW